MNTVTVFYVETNSHAKSFLEGRFSGMNYLKEMNKKIYLYYLYIIYNVRFYIILLVISKFNIFIVNLTITLYIHDLNENFYIGEFSNPKLAYSCGLVSLILGNPGSPGYDAGLFLITLHPPLRVQSWF